MKTLPSKGLSLLSLLVLSFICASVAAAAPFDSQLLPKTVGYIGDASYFDVDKDGKLLGIGLSVGPKSSGERDQEALFVYDSQSGAFEVLAEMDQSRSYWWGGKFIDGENGEKGAVLWRMVRAGSDEGSSSLALVSDEYYFEVRYIFPGSPVVRTEVRLPEAQDAEIGTSKNLVGVTKKGEIFFEAQGMGGDEIPRHYRLTYPDTLSELPRSESKRYLQYVSSGGLLGFVDYGSSQIVYSAIVDGSTNQEVARVAGRVRAIEDSGFVWTTSDYSSPVQLIRQPILQGSGGPITTFQSASPERLFPLTGGSALVFKSRGWNEDRKSVGLVGPEHPTRYLPCMLSPYETQFLSYDAVAAVSEGGTYVLASGYQHLLNGSGNISSEKGWGQYLINVQNLISDSGQNNYCASIEKISVDRQCAKYVGGIHYDFSKVKFVPRSVKKLACSFTVQLGSEQGPFPKGAKLRVERAKSISPRQRAMIQMVPISPRGIARFKAEMVPNGSGLTVSGPILGTAELYEAEDWISAPIRRSVMGPNR